MCMDVKSSNIVRNVTGIQERENLLQNVNEMKLGIFEHIQEMDCGRLIFGVGKYRTAAQKQ